MTVYVHVDTQWKGKTERKRDYNTTSRHHFTHTACVSASVFSLYFSVYVHVFLCMCMYMFMCMHMYMCMCMCTFRDLESGLSKTRVSGFERWAKSGENLLEARSDTVVQIVRYAWRKGR